MGATRLARAGVLTAAALLIAAGCGKPKEVTAVKVADGVYCVSMDGVALDGWDPVSYFEPGGPVAGDPAITLKWSGATWRFASAVHRDAFKKDPKAYAPQFGGVCAFAVSVGKHLEGVHQRWTVKDGKLYVNNNIVAWWLFRLLPGTLDKAEVNWKKGELVK